jgi:hypothetical protein
MASSADLRTLRNQIESWARGFLHDDVTLFKGSDADSDGDSMLLSGLLFYSGESWAGQSIIRSMDSEGGLWRSPYRLASRRDGDYGGNRFSMDQCLGVLLYLVAEFKYGERDRALGFARRWGRWMEDHKSQGEFSLCDWKWTDPDAMTYCCLEGDLFGCRGAIIREVFKCLGIDSPNRKRGGIFRRFTLGDGSDARHLMNQFIQACHLGPRKFMCHLAVVTSVLLSELGWDDVQLPNDGGFGQNGGFDDNPFVLWVKNGRRPNDELREAVYSAGIRANSSHEAGVSGHHQWAWERSSLERDDQNRAPIDHSCGWDVIFMINLLLSERFV